MKDSWKLIMSQPSPGFIKIVMIKNEEQICYHILPKPLFKEPDSILLSILRKEICGVMTDKEELQHQLLDIIISNVNCTVEDTKLPMFMKEELRNETQT